MNTTLKPADVKQGMRVVGLGADLEEITHEVADIIPVRENNRAYGRIKAYKIKFTDGSENVYPSRAKVEVSA